VRVFSYRGVLCKSVEVQGVKVKFPKKKKKRRNFTYPPELSRFLRIPLMFKSFHLGVLNFGFLSLCLFRTEIIRNSNFTRDSITIPFPKRCVVLE
jgi:hypothetical protein